MEDSLVLLPLYIGTLLLLYGHYLLRHVVIFFFLLLGNAIYTSDSVFLIFDIRVLFVAFLEIRTISLRRFFCGRYCTD